MSVFDKKTKLILASLQVENISKLIIDNEYEQFLVGHLIPVKYELERQLTNLQNSSKLKES